MSFALSVYPSALYITCNHPNGSSLWCFQTCIIFCCGGDGGGGSSALLFCAQYLLVHFFGEFFRLLSCNSLSCLAAYAIPYHKMTYSHLSHLNGYTTTQTHNINVYVDKCARRIYSYAICQVTAMVIIAWNWKASAENPVLFQPHEKPNHGKLSIETKTIYSSYSKHTNTHPLSLCLSYLHRMTFSHVQTWTSMCFLRVLLLFSRHIERINNSATHIHT